MSITPMSITMSREPAIGTVKLHIRAFPRPHGLDRPRLLPVTAALTDRLTSAWLLTRRLRLRQLTSVVGRQRKLLPIREGRVWITSRGVQCTMLSTAEPGTPLVSRRHLREQQQNRDTGFNHYTKAVNRPLNGGNFRVCCAPS